MLALLLAFPTLHWSYGFGFLRGVLEFILLGRYPMRSFSFRNRDREQTQGRPVVALTTT
jgi:hypothetical protein